MMDVHVHPGSGTAGGARAAPAQTGKARLGKTQLPNGQCGSDPILQRGMCPTCESGVSKGHKHGAKNTPVTTPVLLQKKIIQVQERNIEQR